MDGALRLIAAAKGFDLDDAQAGELGLLALVAGQGTEPAGASLLAGSAYGVNKLMLTGSDPPLAVTACSRVGSPRGAIPDRKNPPGHRKSILE